MRSVAASRIVVVEQAPYIEPALRPVIEEAQAE